MSVNRLIGAACAIALGLASVSVHADVMVGGSAMLPQKNIVQNAVNSKDHTTLVAAVKAAGLVDTLQGKGPFTVFAPVNAAFDALPAGTVDTLLKPENKAHAHQGADLSRGSGSPDGCRTRSPDREGQWHGGAHHGERRQAMGHEER